MCGNNDDRGCCIRPTSKLESLSSSGSTIQKRNEWEGGEVVVCMLRNMRNEECDADR